MNKKIITFTLLMIVIVNSITNSVRAEEKEQIVIGEIISDSYRYMHERGNDTFWSRSRFLLRKSDGAFVYCIQPFTEISEDSTYSVTTEDFIKTTKISFEVWKKIERIAYYGYGYKADEINHTSSKWYVAAQMLIWKIADSNVKTYFTTSVRGERDNSVLSKEMAEINKLVDEHNITPKFQDIPNQILIGQTIILNDVNNVLSTYDVDNVEGGFVEKEDQKLIITATNSKEIKFDLVKRNNRYDEPMMLYYATDSQNVVRRGNIEPIILSYNMNIIGGTVAINKLDSATNSNKVQGEGSLEGAIYGIYQADGTKVGILTTNNNGFAKSDEILGLGTYYLLEEKASIGYQLDSKKYYFEITKNNLNPKINVYEDVIEQEFKFVKVIKDAETGNNTPEQGVIFVIYNNKNEEIYRLATDEQGIIKFSLPYGTYTVKQLTTTSGYEKVDDFILEVRDSGPTINKVIVDNEISARLKVIKIDSNTKAAIRLSGIKFKIYDVINEKYICQKVSDIDSKTICEYETDKNGEFITPNVLGHGTYRLEEVDQIIDGYLWNKNTILFTIDEEINLENDSEYGQILSIKFENTPVKGEIKINKVGEISKFIDGTIKYSTKPLDNIVYGLYAKEDIIVNGKVIIKKDTKISEKVTDENGMITFDNLYLGKYFIKEISTVDGYVLDNKIYDIELSYKDQYTPIVVCSKTLTNKLISGTLDFIKIDTTTSKPLSNTVIELYTENHKLIYSGITDEKGEIIIDRLPQGKYYILEKQAPEGYKIDTTKLYFEIVNDEEIVEVTMKNEFIDVPITYKSDYKIDIITCIGLILTGIGIIIYNVEKETE